MNSYFLLAPMATLSHEAFRRTVASFGFCDEYFNEMINAGSLIHQGPFEKYYLMNEIAKEKNFSSVKSSSPRRSFTESLKGVFPSLAEFSI